MDLLAAFLVLEIGVFEIYFLLVCEADFLLFFLVFAQPASLPFLFFTHFFIFNTAIQFAAANDIFENHVIFGQGASFISEDILDLTQIFIDGGVVSSAVEVVLGRIAGSVLDEEGPLEKFDHLHCDHQRYGHEIGHQQPPLHGEDPKVRGRNVLHYSRIAVFKNRVEQRADKRDDNLPDENLNNNFVNLDHQL